ncbi:TetR family transcriptional regulator [Parasphingorhabdus sp.]|uniref:TetR family transcriptional regulator n=1 Tax=Parasphingorhabdus sp. TaxID=2709688 RepID=UPI003C762EB8
MTPKNPQMSPAERRRERQRRLIIEAATELFEANGGEEGGGYAATTIEQVAENSDISVRTFFRYFETKDDVIYLDVRRAVEDQRHFIERRLDEGLSPENAALMGTIEQALVFSADKVNRKRLERGLTSTNFTDRRAAWRAMQREMLEELLTPHIKAEGPARRAKAIAWLTSAIFDCAISAWQQDPRSDLRDRIKAAVKDLADALCVINLPGNEGLEALLKPLEF